MSDGTGRRTTRSTGDGREETEGTAYLEGGSGPRGDGAAFVEPHLRSGESQTGNRYLIGATLGEGGMAVVH